jgi:hypothetical protein
MKEVLSGCENVLVEGILRHWLRELGRSVGRMVGWIIERYWVITHLP